MLPLRKHKVKLGSPPRGRGKGKDYATAETMQGITPAWAGKSCPARCRSQSCGDHPRVGGEKAAFMVRFNGGIGSPPRGRGKENVPGPQLGAERITPAWAGKSVHVFSFRWWVGDHPRVGGEKTKKIP